MMARKPLVERARSATPTAAVVVIAMLSVCLGGCPVYQDQRVPNASPLVTEPITGRGYKLYVSSRYHRKRPAPVIISLHGTPPWDTADRQMGEWKKIAEDHGAILICPTLLSSDGIIPAGDAGLRALLLQDERLVLTILSQLQYKYNIDRRNIFLTSWSGGGYPLWFIGLRHPDLFTAICSRQSTFRQGSVEGWFPPEAKAMPILIFYGTFDVVPVVVQSRDAYNFLNARGFTKVRMTTTEGGHQRHPEVAMNFFLENWRRGPYRATVSRGGAPPRR